MDNLSEFAERLKELMIENDLTQSRLAENIKVETSTISRYLSGQNIPEIDVLIGIADYFNCSVDFLAGRTDDYTHKTYKECPPFPAQFKNLLTYFGVSRYKLQQETKIAKSVMHYWETGKYQPSIENLIKLATRYNVSLDFILGRVDYE